MKKQILITFVIFLITAISAFSQELTGKQIVKKSYDLTQGETNEATMTLIIKRDWERSIKFKSWASGRELSLVYITYPPKDKGQSFLKRHNEMWNWSPKISRMIKLPPSMLSQGWMGSDYSNDDILKEASIVEDYNHKVIGEEFVDGIDCYKIELIPKEDAAVVWGKLIKWIAKKEFWQLKTLYFDEDGYEVKLETAKEIKQMHDRKIPTRMEIIPLDEENKKTILLINSIKFNTKIPKRFFSQQSMKRVR